jgi:3-oxoacyl-[acyl-carrier protein] reductase
MNLQLVGKRALVTGALEGIGVAIAEVLAREGARVLVHGRDLVRVNAVVELIVSKGGQAMPITGDLATDDGAASVYSNAKSALGRIDILINNAGAYEARPWFETTPVTWRMFFETDVLSAVRQICDKRVGAASSTLPLAWQRRHRLSWPITLQQRPQW